VRQLGHWIPARIPMLRQGFMSVGRQDGAPPNVISGTAFFEQAKASPVRGVAV
jgi:hypothetical protein